ncbi:MAG: GatB/YqeY domain-containing protein, partial [Desulfobacterales bacterium]
MSAKTIENYGWSPDRPISLLAKLKNDLKQALRNKDQEVKSAIRLIMAEFPKLTVPITLESGKKTTRPKKDDEITNDDIVGIIRGLVKSEHTVLELINEDSSEYLRILESYLPQMASPEEIAAWIKANIDFANYKNKMQAMGTIMKHFGPRADGKSVNQILQNWNF